MRILVVGSTGVIGRAVVEALSARHAVVSAHRGGSPRVDITDPSSIEALYAEVGRVDAVVAAAGAAKFGPLSELSEADFRLGLDSKLMGQLNLVRLGIASVADGGSFTLTSGILGRSPMPGSAAISPVNAALEGFARAAALELPRRIRINVVSPPWVAETLQAMGMDPASGAPAATVARAYVRSVEGSETGETIEVAR